MSDMFFPKIRMRDRRKDERTRAGYRETGAVSPKDLIMPVFIKEGMTGRAAIRSMPGIYQLSIEEAVSEAKKVHARGIPSVILFGIPLRKDPAASRSYSDNGIVQKAIRAIKARVPGLTVIGDVCMCEYTSHGHCGIIRRAGKTKNITVDNDKTIKILARIAVSYAKAGADVVAPSAMMDGQVREIKRALLTNNYPEVRIMSYSSKYASGFYGPFRDAAESPPKSGDRKTYQMDYHNSDEAVLEARLDVREGADILMVKPALGYQDIIYRVKKELRRPLACYSVSGEYAMVKAAAAAGCLDEGKIVLEMLTGFKRAGADFIITYHALEAAKWMKDEG